jgi:hypothetical protein
MDVGSDTDQTGRLTALGERLDTMEALAPTCAPDAVEQIGALAAALAALTTAWQTGDSAKAKQTDYAALAHVRVAGEIAWKAMGLPAQTWAYLPLNDDGSG